ncbi:hypothetical protein V2J09_005077 [Rumex salicifolius]
MVVSSPSPLFPRITKKTRPVGSVPVIDISDKTRPGLAELIVKACEGHGMFKVVNHGVSHNVVDRLENEGLEFFLRPAWEKQQAGPGLGGPDKPYGYGCKNIGFNGDMGELEYLLLHTHPLSISHVSSFISSHDSNINFSEAVNDYVRAVRGLACELLDLMAKGLRVTDSGVFSRLIRDVHSDSVLRLNHYPPSSVHVAGSSDGVDRVGFGEHTDPQILTVLRSNDVGGLQLCTRDGHWVGVPPDPHGFYVMVGDLLQVMTNGRFESVKHRVMSSTGERRMSTVYFGAPPLNARISPLKQLEEATKTNTNGSECKYKTFTWSEYKKAAYALRLGDCRLNLFKRQLI